ncbi:hypothetical protein TNCV_1088501 [Trichonephila clavipes]|uniref:Uncharacterized protein n=1 Tax=Trichonephila clavipes TaxID=2585209 RepID=A0A8X6VL58_TRICX|nr:hypothetical protein TNCV_1088501 [Trichonephila clavipes]
MDAVHQKKRLSTPALVAPGFEPMRRRARSRVCDQDRSATTATCLWRICSLYTAGLVRHQDANSQHSGHEFVTITVRLLRPPHSVERMMLDTSMEADTL